MRLVVSPLLMGLVLLDLGCSAPPPARPATVRVTPPPTVHATPGPKEPEAQPKPVTVVPSHFANDRFVLTSGTYIASLQVWPAGDDRIRFTLEVEADPPAGKCTGMLEGHGRKHPQAQLGAESRELEGEAVLVDQYFHQTSECSLSVLLDELHTYAWVEVSQCSLQSDGCPFGDVGVFKRVDALP